MGLIGWRDRGAKISLEHLDYRLRTWERGPSAKEVNRRMFKNTLIKVLVEVVLILALIIAGLLVSLNVRTSAMLDDYSSVYRDEKYNLPVYIDGIDVIKQDVSCGYAVIEMFSAWCGKDITEESLYSEYGKVVTSTGKSFCAEMNKQFPEYTTTIHKYMKNTELIDAAYKNLANGIPVPFEWAALNGDVWTLHYSLIVGMDIPGDKVTVANPYGYYEELSLSEFLNRTSFEAYEGMPWFLKMGFAVGIFEKNTIFTVE